MTATSHTPGPWSFTYLSGGLMGVCAKGFGLLFSADTYRKGSPLPDELEADLRLCAVAPEMLIALKGILAALSQPHTFPADIEAARIFARTAIAAAEEAAV